MVSSILHLLTVSCINSGKEQWIFYLCFLSGLCLRGHFDPCAVSEILVDLVAHFCRELKLTNEVKQKKNTELRKMLLPCASRIISVLYLPVNDQTFPSDPKMSLYIPLSFGNLYKTLHAVKLGSVLPFWHSTCCVLKPTYCKLPTSEVSTIFQANPYFKFTGVWAVFLCLLQI